MPCEVKYEEGNEEEEEGEGERESRDEEMYGREK